MKLPIKIGFNRDDRFSFLKERFPYMEYNLLFKIVNCYNIAYIVDQPVNAVNNRHMACVNYITDYFFRKKHDFSAFYLYTINDDVIRGFFMEDHENIFMTYRRDLKISEILT